MSIESELRISISGTDLSRIEESCSLGPPVRVTDLTFGCSGPTSMQTHGWVLRVRLVDGEAPSLQVKKALDAAMSAWLEESVAVDSAHRLLEVLHVIGMQPGLFIDRSRRSGSFKGLRVAVDSVSGLGLFIELEHTSADTQAPAFVHLQDAAQSLGLAGRELAQPYGAALLERLGSDSSFRQWHKEQIEKFLGHATSDA